MYCIRQFADPRSGQLICNAIFVIVVSGNLKKAEFHILYVKCLWYTVSADLF